MVGEAETVTEPSGDSKARVNVRCTNGNKFSVDLDLSWTVGALKVVLAEKSDIPADQQRLIYKGRVLKDDHSLQSYGLQNDHTVHLVRGASSSAVAVAATGGTAADSAAATKIAVPASNAGAAGVNIGSDNLILPGLGNNVGAAGLGLGLPEFQQVQQQLMQNPNIMREMINMPAVQSLMNNPDLMRNLIMSNPQMRDIIDRNPGLAHILNDPGTLRQTLDAARNPELMREMMRNTDRAMSNIESSPEGFNMLRRMYETVQEPFLNAATMGADGGNDLASNPFAALLGGQDLGPQQTQNPTTNGRVENAAGDQAGSVAPNTVPLPNPWNPSQNTAGTGNAGAAGQTTGGARLNMNPGGLGGGLAGAGLPDFGSLSGGIGTVDPALMQQMLQNPAISQMMQSFLSNPQYINQIMNMQPHLQAMLSSNPQFREMLQSPEFLRQISSPESLLQMFQLQRTIMPQLNNQAGQAPGANGDAGANVDLNSLLGMLRAMPLTTPEVNTVPPEQLYASQLSQLQDMGFVDNQANIRALSATGGNVHAAVEILLGNMG